MDVGECQQFVTRLGSGYHQHNIRRIRKQTHTYKSSDMLCSLPP